MGNKTKKPKEVKKYPDYLQELIKVNAKYGYKNCVKDLCEVCPIQKYYCNIKFANVIPDNIEDYEAHFVSHLNECLSCAYETVEDLKLIFHNSPSSAPERNMAMAKIMICTKIIELCNFAELLIQKIEHQANGGKNVHIEPLQLPFFGQFIC